jgi:hypothetical protein
MYLDYALHWLALVRPVKPAESFQIQNKRRTLKSLICDRSNVLPDGVIVQHEQGPKTMHFVVLN